jgi:uncharacterized protein YaeQ
MARRGSLRRFRIDVVDRATGAETRLDLRLAQHPSEDEAFLVARVLARALLDVPGIEFSAGVCVGDEPALSVPGEVGESRLAVWIEVGVPDAKRLRRACHRAEEVVVASYRPREAQRLERPEGRLAGRVRHLALDPGLVAFLAERLERANAWRLVRDGDRLEAIADDETFPG